MTEQARTHAHGARPLPLLLWLKWTLMWRGYRRDRMRVLGTVVMLLFFVPVSLGMAIGCWEVAHRAPLFAPYLLRSALGFTYLLWLVTPLLGFPLNEAYDPTRLFVYPVSYRTLFAAAVLGSFFDFSTLLMLPMLISLLILFSPWGAAALVSTAIVALFLLQTLATAHAVMLALIGFLRSRRFRDITMVLLPLLGMGWYIFQQTALHHMALLSNGFRSLIESPLWSVMAWLPPGWAASGLLAARLGEWGQALLYLGLLALACFVMGLAASMAMQKLYQGDRGPTAGSSRRRTEAVADLPAREGSLLSPPLAAMVRKEWRYLVREPQYKIVAINMLYTLAILGVGLYFNTHSFAGGIGFLGMLRHTWTPFWISGFLLLTGLPIVFNIFGGEGAAITLLFSFPTARRTLFLGKNLVHALFIGAICALGVLGGCAVAGTLPAVPLALAWVAIAMPVVLSAGNLISVRFPHRMVVRGQRWGRAGQVALGGSGAGAGAGCGYAFVYAGCYLATLVALLPAIAAIVLPILLHASPAWYALSLPLALAYALGLYAVGLHVASEWVISRESAIVEKILPAE